LLKTYSSLCVSLITQAITEDAESSFMSFFFGEGTTIARIITAYFHYHKKLALSLGALIMNYTSKLDKPSVLLAFNLLLCLFPKKQMHDKDNAVQALFENTLKKMYNEFARVSKFGGGGYQVQDKLTICSNCFVEMLSLHRKTAYKLGFLYIRQMCLHLRTIRAKPTADAVKNVYSW